LVDEGILGLLVVGILYANLEARVFLASAATFRPPRGYLQMARYAPTCPATIV